MTYEEEIIAKYRKESFWPRTIVNSIFAGICTAWFSSCSYKQGISDRSIADITQIQTNMVQVSFRDGSTTNLYKYGVKWYFPKEQIEKGIRESKSKQLEASVQEELNGLAIPR